MPIFLWSTVVNQLQKPVVALGRRSGSARAIGFGSDRVTVVIGSLLTALGVECGGHFCSSRKSAIVVGLLRGHRLACPCGVFFVNDGMPTQMPWPGGSRQSCDDIGIIDGASRTQFDRGSGGSAGT